MPQLHKPSDAAQTLFRYPHDSPCGLSAQDGKDSYARDLPADTGNHDVDSQFACIIVIGDGGDGTTNSLQEKGDDIEGYEKDGVRSRLEAGKRGRVGGDDSGESQIDGCGDEGRGYR